MLYKSDTAFINYLINTHKLLGKDWDNFLVISGVTGAGKSIFMLQLIETYYRIILKMSVSELLMNNITGDIIRWCENLTTLKDYDINVYDEGLLSMDSKDSMTKTQKEVKKIFNTVRSSKRLFNVIIIQDWFSLTKYFREHRATSLVYINKRGHYKFFTKQGIKYLNGFNERKMIKSMEVAYPYCQNTFPDYNGVLRKPYYDYINKLKVREMKASIEVIKESKNKVNVATAIFDDVERLMNQGYNYKQMKEELGVSINAVCAAAKAVKTQNEDT